ncbi:MAG: SGNH/GDSL hydrolase family protein [Pirellulaceae bacterium]
MVRWLVVGILAVSLGWVYRHYWLARPVGRGPAGPAVPREPFDHVWMDRPVLLLGIGDSVTAGLGASRAELSYFARLVNNPPHDDPSIDDLCLGRVLPQLETLNRAVSGSNSLQHLEVVEQLPEQSPATFGLVVLTTGGNDLIHWYGRTTPREGAMYGATWQQAQPWIKSFEQRLGRMLDLLAARFPGGCQIFLGDIYDPTDGLGDAPSVFLPHWPDGLAIHAAYNAVIRRCAERREWVHCVPIHATFLGHGSHCTQFWRPHYCAEDPHYWYYSNIEDPNDRGYDALRRVFLNEIARVLAPVSSQ